jgi:integrase
MDMAKIDDWLSAIPSPYTRKTYKAGIKKFEAFYGEGIETLIKKTERETGRIIEKFYVWLKDNGHGQNTCRNLVNSPIQFLKYFGNEPKYRKSLGLYRTVPTTRDHRAKIQEIQAMAKLADLREQILLEIYLLGLRIGDVSTLEWQTFDVSGECPISIQIMTRKEEVVARSFVTEEFKNLLEKYLPLLDKSNKYLFQSKRKMHLSTKQINNIFKKLVERAGIKNHGLFRWHTGRKLFLRSCAELGISSWSAKLIVGKSIPASDDTYVHDAELKGDFLKISKVLRLFPKPVANGQTKQMLDVVFQVLRTLVEDKMKENGLMKITIPIDWQTIYEKLLPEEEKPEHVMFT